MAQIQTNAGAVSARTVFAPVRGAGDRSRRRWTVLGLAAAGLAVVAIGALAFGRVQEAPASTTPVGVGGVEAQRPALDAYAPGGSIYQQQVPAATSADPAYAPGGSVYQQQVP